MQLLAAVGLGCAARKLDAGLSARWLGSAMQIWVAVVSAQGPGVRVDGNQTHGATGPLAWLDGKMLMKPAA